MEGDDGYLLMTASTARCLVSNLARRRPVALLHGEAALLGDGPLSDVDCAVRDDGGTGAIEDAVHEAENLGLRLVAVWPYDCRGVALFFASDDLADIVHLDLLADATGQGKYGIRTGLLLAKARPSANGWLTPDPDDALLYLLSKRTLKRQHERVDAILASRDSVGEADLAARARVVLSPPARARVAALGIGSAPHRTASAAGRIRYALAELRRHVRRVLHPVGAWIHLVVPPDCAGATVSELTSAEARSSALIRVVPVSTFVSRLPLIASKWRHGATLTVGTAPARGATTNIRVASPIAAPGAVVEVLAQRSGPLLAAHS